VIPPTFLRGIDDIVHFNERHDSRRRAALPAAIGKPRALCRRSRSQFPSQELRVRPFFHLTNRPPLGFTVTVQQFLHAALAPHVLYRFHTFAEQCAPWCANCQHPHALPRPFERRRPTSARHSASAQTFPIVLDDCPLEKHSIFIRNFRMRWHWRVLLTQVIKTPRRADHHVC
jgi:hypothetical protein